MIAGRLGRALGLCASLVLAQLAACAAVAGLEDRTLLTTDAAPPVVEEEGDGGGGPPPVSVQCAESELVCDQGCVSATDPNNCGACGNVCAATQVCAATGCSDTCPANTTKCDRSCVDTTSDVANCGGCGTACTAPASATPACRAGACGFDCNIGFSPCATGCCADPPTPAWGLEHGCVVVADGKVRCWGGNTFGQLGNGTTNPSPDVAVDVQGLTDNGNPIPVTQVEVGHTSSCAVLANGHVRCWGANNFGQLGDGTFNPSPVAVRASGIVQGSLVAVGTTGHACAIVSNGKNVKCWGRNDFGQVGDGTKNDRPIPTFVVDAGTPRALALGDKFSCVLNAGGKVRCWGDAAGTGVAGGSTVPVQIGNLSNVIALSADAGHVCALISGSRTVKCWGANQAGQLGVAGASGTRPVEVPNLKGASFIGTGLDHSCAIVNGRATCWGGNSRGELGDGTKTASVAPVLGPNFTISSLGAGGNTTCARLTGGGALPASVTCWGRKTATTDWAPAAIIGGIP